MGGGGDFYHRDISDGYQTNARGVSQAAEALMSLTRADPGMLPRNRRIVTNARCPVCSRFDDTGSLGDLPKIIVDKMPLVAGQTAENQYLTDVEISVGAVGDLLDQAPLQVGDFTQMRYTDDWMKRIWLEGEGLGDSVEAYEHMAYFDLHYLDMPNAECPIMLFTGDEGIRPMLYKSDLERLFGGTHQNVSAVEVFTALKRKFKDNVFLIHRWYRNAHDDAVALRGWQECIDDDHIIRLGHDKSIADLTLGLFALVGGKYTLEEYLEHMISKRVQRQSDARIADIRRALSPLWVYLQKRGTAHKGEQPSAPRPMENEVSFPTPDDVNAQMGDEFRRSEVERFLADLKQLLTSPNRPTPSENGWTYCEKVALPTHVSVNTDSWKHIQATLAKANWTAEIVHATHVVRIRRIA